MQKRSLFTIVKKKGTEGIRLSLGRNPTKLLPGTRFEPSNEDIRKQLEQQLEAERTKNNNKPVQYNSFIKEILKTNPGHDIPWMNKFK